MKNFKAFSLLGLLFALVLISSTVTADEKTKEEDKGKAVAVEATKETDVPGDVGKKGYGGGGGGGGCGCCKKYIHVCGKQCCYSQNEGTEAVSEAATDANPDGYGWGGGKGGGGYRGGKGGGGYGGGKGGGGGHGGGKGGGGGYGGGKGGGGGYGGGKGGGGWGGGGT